MATGQQLYASDLEQTPQLHNLQSLDSKQREIRLIRLSGTDSIHIETHSLNQPPTYHALSYYWGPPFPTRVVRVEGQDVAIRETVAEMFDRLQERYDPKTLFWIDMLCIQQHVLQERNSQVNMMADIYGHAVDVITWLGRADNSSRTAFQLLMKKVECPADASAETTSDPSTCLSTTNDSHAEATVRLEANDRTFDSTFAETVVLPALRDVALRPYWSRVWIAQEVILAKQSWVLCGDDWTSLEDLHDIGLPWIYRSQPKDSSGAYKRSNNAQHQDATNAWATIRDLYEFRVSFRREGIKLREVLETFARNDCSNPLDKVYGLRALNDTLGRIEVDYFRAPIEVYLNLLQEGLLHDLDRGYAFQTIPRLAFDMGLPEKDLPVLISQAKNADVPIPVEGEVIGQVSEVTDIDDSIAYMPQESGSMLALHIKMTFLQHDEPCAGHPQPSYILGYYYKPPNQPQLFQKVKPDDLLIHIQSFYPINLILRLKTEPENCIRSGYHAIYEVVGTIRPKNIVPAMTFEINSEPFLGAETSGGALTLTSSNSAIRSLHLGTPSHTSTYPTTDKIMDPHSKVWDYWKPTPHGSKQQRLRDIYRFLVDSASLPSLFLWEKQEKVHYILGSSVVNARRADKAGYDSMNYRSDVPD